MTDRSSSTLTSDSLVDRFLAVRAVTEELAAPLSPEDQTVQSMPDVSPTKWHRAHTTWFFETFVLVPHVAGYQSCHPQYGYLFNSYYEQAGARHPRPERGLVSRPSAAEVGAYRQRVDEALAEALSDLSDDVRALVELGLHHEQQHQELLLMDIKHVLSCNPLFPAYRGGGQPGPVSAGSPLGFETFAGGIEWVGDAGERFAFDNERPRHRQLVEPFALGDRLVTNAEWMAFIADGGYHQPVLWLSEGWATVMANAWECPLYWRDEDGLWLHHTLDGLRPVDPADPVCHVSYFEADAYARWAGYRLPTEAEWEVATASAQTDGNFLDSGALRPTAAHGSGLRQMFGDVWEWTASPYVPYRGFRPAAGAVGEYNGKFMVNQQVLRGGCCVTPAGHVRATYRNFFPPASRWAFSGLRLAQDR